MQKLCNALIQAIQQNGGACFSQTAITVILLLLVLRWLKAVSSTFQDYDDDVPRLWCVIIYRSLSIDATIMVSRNCLIINKHFVIIFIIP